MAIIIKKQDMPINIKVSFQTYFNPTPFIMTDLTIIKYHLAGTILDIILKGRGIFSIGNIKPLNIIVGRNIPTSEINMAVCCESVVDEINKPSESASMVNNILSEKSNMIFPLMGTSNTNVLNNKMLEILKNETIR